MSFIENKANTVPKLIHLAIPLILRAFLMGGVLLPRAGLARGGGSEPFLTSIDQIWLSSLMFLMI